MSILQNFPYLIINEHLSSVLTDDRHYLSNMLLIKIHIVNIIITSIEVNSKAGEIVKGTDL